MFQLILNKLENYTQEQFYHDLRLSIEIYIWKNNLRAKIHII